jgi:zinc/manganese transport system ATP-binding protein
VVRLDGAAARIGGQTVWSDVSLTIAEGEFVAILGPNGSGKTTLLRVLLGALGLAAGSAAVLGREPGAANREIGYLPQRRHFDASIRIRGVDVVRLGLDGMRWGLPVGRGSRGGRGVRERVDEAIAMVGAEHYATRPIGRLSGGEQQRLLIAQALVSRPRVLILDEPLDSLDLPNQTAVAALLGRICAEQGISVLLVAHDVNPLLSYLDRVVYFGGGRAAVGAPEEVITAETLSRLYGLPVEVLRTADDRLFVVGLPEAPAHHSDRHQH